MVGRLGFGRLERLGRVMGVGRVGRSVSFVIAMIAFLLGVIYGL